MIIRILLLSYNPFTYIISGVNGDQSVWVRMLSGSVTFIILMAVFAIFKLFSKSEKENVNEISSKTEEENVDVPTFQENPIVPTTLYSAPEIKSQKRSIERSFWSGRRVIILLELVDGVKGNIFYKQSKKYYFKEISQYSTTSHYYDTFANCVNAYHYFTTKGELLKVGYLGAYS